MTKKQTIFQADQVLESQEKQDEQIASWEEAVKYRNKFSVRQNDGEEYSLNCDLKELSQYGPGLILFFELIKYSALVFLLMSLISIPSLYSNADGQSLDSIQLSTNSLAKLSLSNQPEIKLIVPASDATDAEFEAIKAQNQAKISEFVSDSSDRLNMVAIPDICYSVIFFIFIVWYTFRSRKVAKESQLKNSLPSHYTIEVSGFPSTIIDAKEISNHFRNHFGADVFECQLVRNYYNTLFLHKEEATLIDQMKSEKSRIKALGMTKSKDLEKLAVKLTNIQAEINKQVQDKMKGKTLSHNEYPSIKAFVILNNIEDKMKIEKEYQEISSCLCFSSYPSKFKLQGQYDLKIEFRPDEPSNLLWENLEVSSLNRAGRTFIVFLLVIIVMLITFAIIIIANIVKPSNQASCPKNSISRTEAAASSALTACYCTSVSFSDMSKDKDLQNLCWDTWVKYATTYALTIVTGLVILIVNFILRKTVESLGKFNRYNTITKFTSSTTLKLFLALFVNTALITLFLQADIYGFIPAVTFSKPIPPLSDWQSEKQTEFSADFDRNWYLSIGTKITVTVFFFIITHFIFEFCLAPVFRYFRERKVKNLAGKDVQRVANKAIIGPDFSITFYYASTLNIIFTTLFYASGIPIMLFAGFFILSIQYWVYKYRLLRICKRPPTYDAGLNQRILQILPWSLVLHLAVGIYMYGQPLIFPRNEDQLKLIMSKETDSVYIETQETKTIRNRSFNVLYLFIFLLIILAIFILNISIQSFASFIRCLFIRKRSVAPVTQSLSYNEDFANIELRMLPSYNIKVNEQYRYIIQAIDLEKKIDSENSPKVGPSSPQDYMVKDGTDTNNVDQILENI